MRKKRIRVEVEELACSPVRPECQRRALDDALAVAVLEGLAAGSS